MTAVGRYKRSKINSSINVTPMVDVMLVLLIIFMVITPMLHPGMRVKLPSARNPVEMFDADKTDALIVAVLHDGTGFPGQRDGGCKGPHTETQRPLG